MGKAKNASKFKLRVDLESFCETLIDIDYYKHLGTTSEMELFRLVAVKLFKVSDSIARKKSRVNELATRCKLFSKHHQNEINKYFATHFKGPELNFAKKFSLSFNYSDILKTDNKFNYNLRNKVFEKFITINSLCILTDKYKNIKVSKPFVVLKFKCAFPNCPATYNFTLDNDALNKKCILNFTVEQSGPILHRKGVNKSRFISKDKRTEIGKKLIEGMSPDALCEELMQNYKISEDMLDKEDNIKKLVPSKEVLKRIKYETNKKNKFSTQLTKAKSPDTHYSDPLSQHINKANIEGFAAYRNKEVSSNHYKRKDKKVNCFSKYKY